MLVSTSSQTLLINKQNKYEQNKTSSSVKTTYLFSGVFGGFGRFRDNNISIFGRFRGFRAFSESKKSTLLSVEVGGFAFVFGGAFFDEGPDALQVVIALIDAGAVGIDAFEAF